MRHLYLKLFACFLIALFWMLINPQYLIKKYSYDDKCGYRIFKHLDSLYVSHGCVNSSLELKNIWRSNSRILADQFNVIYNFSIVPFTYNLSKYNYTGTEQDRKNLLNDVSLVGDLLLASAEAAMREPEYTSNIWLNSKIREIIFLWDAVLTKGVVKKYFPVAVRGDNGWKSNDEMSNWERLYIFNVRLAEHTMEIQYEKNKSYFDVCDLIPESTYKDSFFLTKIK